jgi:hypothetical protein
MAPCSDQMMLVLLPALLGAQQAKDLALGHVEMVIPHRPHLAKALVQALRWKWSAAPPDVYCSGSPLGTTSWTWKMSE